MPGHENVPYLGNYRRLTYAELQDIYSPVQERFPYAPIKVFSCPEFPDAGREPNGTIWRQCGMQFAIYAGASGKKQVQVIRSAKNKTRSWIFSEACNQPNVSWATKPEQRAVIPRCGFPKHIGINKNTDF